MSAASVSVRRHGRQRGFPEPAGHSPLGQRTGALRIMAAQLKNRRGGIL